jgi:hypothetical protein
MKRIPIHVSTKGSCTGAKSGEPYSPDQCLICWLANNKQEFKFLDRINTEHQTIVSQTYSNLVAENTEIAKIIEERQQQAKYEGGFFQKLSNFYKASFKWLSSGAEFCPDDVQEKRRYICRNCSLANADGICTHIGCGCQVNQKIRLASESCPIHKWEEYKQKPELTENYPVQAWKEYVQNFRLTELEGKDPEEIKPLRKLNLAIIETIHEKLQEFNNIKHDYINNLIDDVCLVMCGGGSTYVQCAWQLAYVMRKLGWSAPIEFWYLGDVELDPFSKKMLEDLQVNVIDATEISKKYPARILHGWELKVYSTFYSKYRYIVFLDTDIIPTQNPEYMFTSPLFYETGNIFWQDPANEFVSLDALWAAGIPVTQKLIDGESGQFYVDKKRWSAELRAALLLNEFSDYYYKFFYGDKTSFVLGWAMLNKNLTYIKRDYSTLDHIYVDDSSYPIYLHKDQYGQLLFQHFILASKELLVEGKGLNNVINKELYLEANQTIKTKYNWNGQIYSWNRLSKEELDFSRRIIGKYIYQEHDFDEIDINKKPHGRIVHLQDNGKIIDTSVKSNGVLTGWSVRIHNNRPQIILFSNHNGHKPFVSVYSFLNEERPHIWVGKTRLINTHKNYSVSLEKVR